MSKEKTTFVKTRHVEIFPIGEKEEVSEIWSKVNSWFDNTWKAANKIITSRQAITSLVDNVIDNDKYLHLENDKIKKELITIDNWYSEEKTNIYQTFAPLLEDLHISDIPAKEKKQKRKEITNDRKDAIKNLGNQHKSKVKKYKPEIDKLKNKAVSMFIDSIHMSDINLTYKQVAIEFPMLPSYVWSALNNKVCSKYKDESFGVKMGLKSLTTYKKNMPVPFNKGNSMTFEKVGKSIVFNFITGVKFRVNFGKDKSNNRHIIDSIIEGKYKFCDSEFIYKKNKLFLSLAVEIPKMVTMLDENKQVGVDVGINVPAYLAMNEGHSRMAIGNREGFIKPRTRIAAQRRALQKNLKFTKGGKGRKKKLAKLDKLEKAERNTVKTLNHKISKTVIDFALKNNAGVIKMEKLTGIARNESSKWILRNWSYFELQNFIEYKAKAFGIEVKYINPAYTSQCCPNCKHISRENRKTQAKFKCVECDFEENADWVGAYNIANSTDYMNKKGAKPKIIKKPLKEMV